MEWVLKDSSTKAKLARVREYTPEMFAETRKQGNIIHIFMHGLVKKQES